MHDTIQRRIKCTCGRVLWTTSDKIEIGCTCGRNIPVKIGPKPEGPLPGSVPSSPDSSFVDSNVIGPVEIAADPEITKKDTPPPFPKKEAPPSKPSITRKDAKETDLITGRCPNCDRPFRVSSQKVGKRGKCPKCGKMFTIQKTEEPGRAPSPVKKGSNLDTRGRERRVKPAGAGTDDSISRPGFNEAELTAAAKLLLKGTFLGVIIALPVAWILGEILSAFLPFNSEHNLSMFIILHFLGTSYIGCILIGRGVDKNITRAPRFPSQGGPGHFIGAVLGILFGIWLRCAEVTLRLFFQLAKDIVRSGPILAGIPSRILAATLILYLGLASLTVYRIGFVDHYAHITARNEHFQRGVDSMNTGNIEAAIVEFSEAIELDPKLGDIYNNRGVAYSMTGREDRAIEDFNKAIELKPRWALPYGNRGESFYRTGEIELALEDYNKALRLNKRLPRVYYQRGVIYEERKEYEKAIRDYQKAAQWDSEGAIGSDARKKLEDLENIKHRKTDSGG